MTDNEQQLIGGLVATLTELKTQQATFRTEQREDMRRLFDRLENFSSNCPVGKQHAEAIKELQSRPERIVGIGAAIVAILAAIGSAFVWTIGRLH